MNKRTIRLLPLLLVILGGVAFWQWPRPTISDVVELYGGAASFAILNKPDSVVAYRLTPFLLESDPMTLSDFPISKGPIAVDNEIAGKLAVALSNPRSYGWNLAKLCIPTYGVRLTFEADGGAVDILLCFECNILAILRGNGMRKGHLVKITVYLTDPRHIEAYRAARKKIIGDATRPPSTLLVIDGLASPDLLIEIEAWAAKP